MQLTWTAATDNNEVTNYKVYMNDALETQVGNTLSYQVNGLSPSTSYEFYITALDAQGNESSKSNTVQGTTSSVPTGKTITMTTTSVSSAWQLVNVNNSGNVFQWTASNSLIGVLEETANAPEFNFGLNDGRPIDIVINSSDDFVGLTELDLWNGESGQGSFITQIDVTNAPNLEILNPRYSQLTSLDVSQNVKLKELIIRGKRQLNNLALNTSNNPELNTLWIDGTGINAVDLSNNPLLIEVKMDDAALTSSVLDQVLIDLDNHGLSNGNLVIANQITGQSITVASAQAYQNLIDKNWTIDVEAPVANKEVVSKVTIIPNPVTTSGNSFSFKTDYQGLAKVKLYNSTGQFIGELYSGEVLKDEQVYTTFGSNSLSSGLYYAVFDFGSKSVRKKIICQE